MFHVTEAHKGRGVLTVKDGKMIVHISLSGKKILNLYCGKAIDAAVNEDDWLKPTVDSVKYEDGFSEEVFGFDVPVKRLDSEFNLALIGKKGVWYDHKVMVTDVE